MKKNFKVFSVNWKLSGIIELNVKESALEKNDTSFIIYFCLGKFYDSLDTYSNRFV